MFFFITCANKFTSYPVNGESVLISVFSAMEILKVPNFSHTNSIVITLLKYANFVHILRCLCSSSCTFNKPTTNCDTFQIGKFLRHACMPKYFVLKKFVKRDSLYGIMGKRSQVQLHLILRSQFH